MYGNIIFNVVATLKSGASFAVWDNPRFYRTLSSLCIGLLVFIAIVNYLIDPYEVYGTRILPGVENNYYHVKLDLFKKADSMTRVLILGSSRAFSIDPDVVEEILGEQCFNFAVPGARAETYYSILKTVLDDYDCPIDTLIIGVDPEAFHPSIPIEPEARFIPGFSKNFIYDKNGHASAMERFLILISMDQFNESCATIDNYFLNRTGRRKMEFFEDGYSVWTTRDSEIRDGTFDLEALLRKRIGTYAERSLYLTEFTDLGESRKKYWEDLITICDQRGITLYVYMTPEHPDLYGSLMSKGAGGIFGKVRDYLDTTVSENGWVFRDYTNCEEAGLSPDLFYDEIHMRPENNTRLARNLLTSPQ